MLAAMIFAVPLTQAVYTAAVLSLFGLKEVDWRGIRYELGKDKTVRMIEYVPYAQVQSAAPQTDETVSL
jgi:hypothetical protein